MYEPHRPLLFATIITAAATKAKIVTFENARMRAVPVTQ